METLEDQQRDILYTLSTLIAATSVNAGATLLRRLQSIRSELSHYDLRDPQQAEEHRRELKTGIDSFFLEISAWDLP